jgi:hypothetical protein
MFFLDMDDKLASEATDGHGDHIRIGYASFDPAEESHEGFAGKDIIQIFIGEQYDAFLFLVDVVDLDQLRRQYDCFCIRGQVQPG